MRLAKHGTGKKLFFVSKKNKDKKYVDMLQKCDQEKHPVGINLSDEVRVFRIKVVRSFLKAGVLLAKIDCFREMLEESVFRLSHVLICIN